MKRQVEVIRQVKTGILLLITLKKYPHLRCYDFSLRHMSFLVSLLWTSLAVFAVGCIEECHERGQSKCILRKFETSAR